MVDADTNDLKKTLKRIWHFIWHDDSIWSWLVNLAIAFILVKFVIYPVLGLMLGTSVPVVAVVSSSMEHNGLSFDGWWADQKDYYESAGISRDDFYKYRFRNGFNKGDLMVIVGGKPKKGDIIVFMANAPEPIIHRIVISDGGKYTTKGDNNKTNRKSRSDEIGITGDRILGKAVFRIPYLGWVKILFMELVSFAFR